MTVQQIYEIANDMTKEILGQTDLVKEDLSNIVDIGTQIFDATSTENAAHSIMDKIGKVKFVIRPYNGRVPGVYRDAWEWGSAMEKIQADLPEAEENESWSLNDGESYDQNLYYAPHVSEKFFNSKVTFEIPRSITDIQIKSSFQSATQANSFWSMLLNETQKSLGIKTDALVMRTINNFIATTIDAEFSGGSGITGHTGTRVVNLLYLYNTAYSKNIGFSAAIIDPDFIRFATFTIARYMERMSKPSDIFNLGSKVRYTPKELQHLVLLSDFAEASKIFLQSNTFHDDLVKINAGRGLEEVPFWQGSGTGFADDKISKIDVTIKKGSSTQDVATAGVLAVLFDHDALGVANLNDRVTSHYNAKGEFTNLWYKTDGSYFNDFNENGIVFVAI